MALGTHHVSHGAAIAQIEVDRRTGLIMATRHWAATDGGLAVNPALVENQIVGQMTQSASRVKAGVTFDKGSQASLDRGSYPVLRFAVHLDVVRIVVPPLKTRSIGAGEAALAQRGRPTPTSFPMRPTPACASFREDDSRGECRCQKDVQMPGVLVGGSQNRSTAPLDAPELASLRVPLHAFCQVHS
jgi:hypothetical protein